MHQTKKITFIRVICDLLFADMEGMSGQSQTTAFSKKLDILEHPLDGSGENQLNLYKYFPGRLICRRGRTESE